MMIFHALFCNVRGPGGMSDRGPLLKFVIKEEHRIEIIIWVSQEKEQK